MSFPNPKIKPTKKVKKGAKKGYAALAIALVLVALFSAVGQAQTDTAMTSTISYGGVRYTNNAPTGGFQAVYGIATPITGPLWSFSTVTAGVYGTVEPDIALVTRVGTKTATSMGWVGILAGPEVDFTKVTEPVTYLAGAAGIVGGYWFSPKYGVWAGAKFKFNANPSAYISGWNTFAGLCVNF